MNCPRCGEAVDPGAVFCGNCGQSLQAAPAAVPAAMASQPAPIPIPQPPVSAQGPASVPAQQSPSPIANAIQQGPVSADPSQSSSVVGPPVPAGATANGLPSYAVADPTQHKAENRATTSLVLGVLSVPGGLIPIIGLVLAIMSIVMATSARPKLAKKLPTTLALIFAGIGLVVTIGAFVYNLQHAGVLGSLDNESKTAQSAVADDSANGQASGAAISGKVVDLPCYRITVPGLENVDSSTTCDFNAFNQTSLSTSTSALIVTGAEDNTITKNNLSTVGKELVEQYLLPQFKGIVLSQQAMGTFAGDPAYLIKGKMDQKSLHAALVYHKTKNGENAFMVIAVELGKDAELSNYDKAWDWK